jgi:hypothetical protein
MQQMTTRVETARNPQPIVLIQPIQPAAWLETTALYLLASLFWGIIIFVALSIALQ